MQWIDEIIIGLVDTYHTHDPYELCDVLSIDIIREEKESPLLLNEDSLYMRNYNDRETIFIRDDLHSNYEKFYLRHELGHAILHPDILCSNQNDLINYDKLEKQANYFAFRLTDNYVDKTDIQDMTIKQIACYVEVPENALCQMVGEGGVKYGSI